MSSATIRTYSDKLCVVEFTYSARQKDAIKALAGAEFDGEQWIVPVMHLPTLKTIFTKLTVEPAVVEAYHALLQRMVADLDGFKKEKGVKGILKKNAVGITAMQAKQSQLALTLR